MRDTAAAYIEARGLRFVGGVAVLVGILAYFLGEERRGEIWKAIKTHAAKLRKRPLRDVTSVETPQTPGPAPASTAIPKHSEETPGQAGRSSSGATAPQ